MPALLRSGRREERSESERSRSSSRTAIDEMKQLRREISESRAAQEEMRQQIQLLLTSQQAPVLHAAPPASPPATSPTVQAATASTEIAIQQRAPHNVKMWAAPLASAVREAAPPGQYQPLIAAVTAREMDIEARIALLTHELCAIRANNVSTPTNNVSASANNNSTPASAELSTPASECCHINGDNRRHHQSSELVQSPTPPNLPSWYSSPLQTLTLNLAWKESGDESSKVHVLI